jgi:hypothetical protein
MAKHKRLVSIIEDLVADICFDECENVFYIEREMLLYYCEDKDFDLIVDIMNDILEVYNKYY